MRNLNVTFGASITRVRASSVTESTRVAGHAVHQSGLGVELSGRTQLARVLSGLVVITTDITSETLKHP